ncbi:hypothetical protein GY45DRAFT_1367883 [Cubamyces sp. BRFM 1775]|nr:hypothetical protein GY45DRAFT_1367883 [Cubamyces sp. BRFM 1775]
MTAFLSEFVLTPFFRRIVIPMAVFVWGFAWLMLSVLIFVAGRLVPQLHSKPPVVVLKPRSPRSPRSPRIRSAPASPVLPPRECDPVPADEAASCQTSVSAPEPSLPSHPSTPPNGRSRASAKKKWSLPTYFFPNRSVPSPKSSLFSEGSATLVGSPSPPRFFPELPMIESATVSEDPSCEQEDDAAPSSKSTPASSPRTGRGMRLSNVKVFKALSRKLSKQKTDPASSRESSPRPSVDLSQEAPAVCEEKNETLMRRRTMDAGSSRSARPGHLLHERNLSLPGEVFTTTFVNPFRSRSKSRKAKTDPSVVDLTEPDTPSPRRSSTSRRMLTSFQLALTSPIQKSHARSNSQSQSQSRRSSVSSTSTAVSTFSAPSVLSSTGSPTSPVAVAVAAPPRNRTQPYAAPYFAPLPRSATPERQSGAGSSSTSSSSQGVRPRPGPRRASSSLPRRPETVAEESAEEGGSAGAEEKLSALGLKLGQLPAEQPSASASVEGQSRLGLGRPRGSSRHRGRVAVSEGSAGLVAAAAVSGRTR